MDIPNWSGIEVQMLVSRLAERILASGWRLAFPLRSPFATLMEPLCRSRQPLRPLGNAAAVVWCRISELDLIDRGDGNLSEEERRLNGEYGNWHLNQLESHSIPIRLEHEKSARDSLLGLADLPESVPPNDAIVYVGGRPDEISAGGEVPFDMRTRSYREFVEEFEEARRQSPVFLVGACGGFSRSLYLDRPDMDQALSERNQLHPTDNRSLGRGLVNRGTLDCPRWVPANLWDVSRLVFRGLHALASKPIG